MKIRIKNPKTTLAGAVVATGTLVSTLYPQYAKQAGAVAAFGVALVGLFAQDAEEPPK